MAIIILIIFLIYWFTIDIYKHYIYYINQDFYPVVNQIPQQNITPYDLPKELRDQVLCMHINNIKEISQQKNKSDIVLDIFCKKYEHLRNIQDRLYIFDTLTFAGAYFPTAHTDIEWNKVRNNGFQIWCLVENKESIGNMFILYNKYLYEKYKDVSIVLRRRNDKILVVKNCWNAEFAFYIDKKYILEEIPVQEFINSTKRFYLDFKPGDCILFLKNTIHMSDHRTSTNNRKAFNFRVAILDQNNDLSTSNKLNISDEDCGYVHFL